MQITRRAFLKYITATAASLGLSPGDIFRIEEVFADVSSPPVIWLQASSCSGCSVSFLNWFDSKSEVANLLTGPFDSNPQTDRPTISLKYHPTLMAASGDKAVMAANNALFPEITFSS